MLEPQAPGRRCVSGVACECVVCGWGLHASGWCVCVCVFNLLEQSFTPGR